MFKYLFFLMLLLSGCGQEITPSWDCTANGNDCHDSSENEPKEEQSPPPPGPRGPVGPVGQPGQNGDSCTVTNSGLVMCGDTSYQIPVPKNGIDGQSCSIYEDPTDILISCPGGISASIHKPKDGKDGKNCTVNDSGLIVCGDTSYQIPTAQNGQDGSSCSVQETDTTVTISCTNGSTSTWNKPKDGLDGEPGRDGTDGILETINPCGTNPSGVDEILFRLNDGSIVAWYKNVGLVKLSAGSYVTTDGSNCRFSVDSSNKLTDQNGNTWSH